MAWVILSVCLAFPVFSVGMALADRHMRRRQLSARSSRLLSAAQLRSLEIAVGVGDEFDLDGFLLSEDHEVVLFTTYANRDDVSFYTIQRKARSRSTTPSDSRARLLSMTHASDQ